MSSYGEIVSVLTRMMDALDHQDREAFANCWSPDLRLRILMFDGHVMAFDGRDDLIGRTTATWTRQASALRHQLGGVMVEFESPDRALARYYCTYVTVGADPALAGMGEYRDVLSRGSDGRWRVDEREHRFLTPLQVRLPGKSASGV